LEIIHYCCFVGNQHLKEVAVCDCESHAATLVRCQFWPGSPERPSVGFHFKLMDLAEKLFLHSQVSVKEFSELILEMSPPMQPNFIPSLYAILNSGCFEEYSKNKRPVRCCPLQGCTWVGRRFDYHLPKKHNIRKDSEKYISLVQKKD